MTSELVIETASTSPSLEETQSDASTTPELPANLKVFSPWLAGLILSVALTSAGAAATAPLQAIFKRRDEILAEGSSTTGVELDQDLLKEIDQVFRQGASDFFEDGMYSAFSRSLVAILTLHGRAAFRAINEYIFSGGGSPDVVSEALRWLPDFNDPATLPQLWAILQRTLTNPSPRIRDGAILGFASLDDPRAKPLLLKAHGVEPIPELRRLIEQVVQQLNSNDATSAADR